ncbi:MAG: acyl-CoA desaturase [Verrucomicrobiales bacterium]|nr:acyl-CoA desaturase [Verrucomicrobiales bacterium]
MKKNPDEKLLNNQGSDTIARSFSTRGVGLAGISGEAYAPLDLPTFVPGKNTNTGSETDSSPDDIPFAEPKRIDLRGIPPYLILHGGCLAVYFTGWSWFAIGAAVFLYLVRMFAITAFYHRYFSHRAFKTSRFMQFVFAALGNTAFQRGPLWWALNHRHHHKHSDHVDDKHSPKQFGFFWSHLGWLTDTENLSTDYKKIKDFARFPELVFLNRYNLIVPALYVAGLAATGWLLETFAPGLGTNAGQLVVWGFFISTVALLHVTLLVNSLAHVWGKRRFDTGDHSRNNWLIAVLTLGEGWHNNHHRYQHSARQGFFWFELDVSYYLLKLMERLGLIYDLKPVPQRVYDEVRELKKIESKT